MDIPEWLEAIRHKETCKLSEQERKRLTRWVIAQIIRAERTDDSLGWPGELSSRERGKRARPGRG